MQTEGWFLGLLPPRLQGRGAPHLRGEGVREGPRTELRKAVRIGPQHLGFREGIRGMEGYHDIHRKGQEGGGVQIRFRRRSDKDEFPEVF